MQKTYNYFEELFQKGFEVDNEKYKKRQSKKEKQATRPSSLGKCQRCEYLKVTEHKQDEDFSQTYKEAVPLWGGTLMHQQFETWAKNAGSNLFIEKEVEWEGIKGTLDLIAKPDGKYVLVDYKGKSGGNTGAYQRSFLESKKGKIPNMVEKQMTFYVSAANKTLGLDMDECIIFHYSRDLSYELKWYLQPFKVRKSIVEFNKKYIKEMKHYVDNGILPDPNPTEFWECSYKRGGKDVVVCPFLNQCKQNKLQLS